MPSYKPSKLWPTISGIKAMIHIRHMLTAQQHEIFHINHKPPRHSNTFIRLILAAYLHHIIIMGGKKVENTKKVAGNAKKAEVAAQKAAAENSKKAVAEDEDWGKGAKSTAKK
jgi:hypothetical protein